MTISKQRVLMSAASAVVFVPLSAHAYIGPGAGMGAIGTVLAVLGAILLAIVGFLWYPVKRLLRKRKSAAQGTEPESLDKPD